MKKLRKISSESVKSLIRDKDLFNDISRRKDAVFRLSGRYQEPKKDPLLEVEITLSRCERVGMFRK